MGTSSKYGGPSPISALIPTFLEDTPRTAAPNEEIEKSPDKPLDKSGENPKEGEKKPIEQNKPSEPKPLPPLPPPASGGRFRTSRSNFNTFAESRDRGSLKRSLSSYVRTGTGGGRRAARRMGAAIPSVRRAISFVQDVANAGINQALSHLGLGNLVGQPAEQALAVLTDVFCPEGGPIDQGIAREAWDEAVLGLTEIDITDITEVTAEQWQAVVTDFIAKTIEFKVINDVGAKGISLPQDVQAIDQLQSDLHELIQGAVDDAIGDRLNVGQTIPQNEIQGLVTDIYERSFAYLEALEE
ncbi:MAG: Qat anti-phage system associated protein QatB [Verrucomicrobiota bacterium]|jgi:hypothetical protein